MPGPYEDVFEEFTASTLPDPGSYKNKVILRADLNELQFSDGVSWAALGSGGGTVDIASMTDAATAATSGEKTSFLNAAGAAQYLAVRDEAASFVLTAANHANRDTHVSAVATVTWNTGHGMTKGDAGVIYQTGAGAVTISAGTGTVTLSPRVSSAATTADGSWLSWTYLGGDELLIVDRGVAVAAGGISLLASPIPVADVGSGSVAETLVFETTMPAMGANAEVEVWMRWDGSGAGNKTWRLKLGSTGTGGSLIHGLTLTQYAGRLVLGFRNQNSASSQVGGNTALSSGFGGTTAANTTTAVDLSSPTRLALILIKATGADVVNFQGAQVKVIQ